MKSIWSLLGVSGVQLKSKWSLSGVYLEYLESKWSPSGIYLEYLESKWSPSGVYLDYLESKWSLTGNVGECKIQQNLVIHIGSTRYLDFLITTSEKSKNDLAHLIHLFKHFKCTLSELRCKVSRVFQLIRLISD